MNGCRTLTYLLHFCTCWNFTRNGKALSIKLILVGLCIYSFTEWLWLAFIASLCIFLNHRLPLGTTRGFRCQEGFPVSCRLAFLKRGILTTFVLTVICWGMEGYLCTVGCLSAFLAFGHQMPVVSPLSERWQPTMSPDTVKCPRGRGEGATPVSTTHPSLRTNTVDARWCPGVISISQNYSLNDQARTRIFSSASPKDSNETERRQELMF